MATTKKTSTTKPPVKRKATKKAHAAPAMRSFALAKDPQPFLSFRATHQTAYWGILCALILVLGIWVVVLNIKVHTIYNQLQINDTTETTVTPKHN
jgi:hypothetical protein